MVRLAHAGNKKGEKGEKGARAATRNGTDCDLHSKMGWIQISKND